MAKADSAGLSVRATFSVAMGPNSHVTGASTIPRPTSAVLDNRLIPPGWKRWVEYSGFVPWDMA